MKDRYVILLKIPSLLFSIFGVYLRFRFAQRAYLKKFRNTLEDTVLEECAKNEILDFEKKLLKTGFSEMLKTIKI